MYFCASVYLLWMVGCGLVLHRLGGLTAKDRRLAGRAGGSPDRDEYRDSGLDETGSRMTTFEGVGLGMLAAIDPATRYTSMQPPSAKLCSHPLQRCPAID